MPEITSVDVERMTSALFIEPGVRSPSFTKFWTLLVLAALIASAGVVGDSTATVIGAMIVAPLMTPILGSALAFVLVDRTHLVRSVLLVLCGSAAVVAVGYLVGWVAAPPDDFAGNSQVAARISPHLIDLVAALATGTAGAFALARTDVSDALPGVAIAISLVPPLAVTGLLLDVHRYHDAGQSALLFGTNVAAIIATGIAVFLAYRVRAAAAAAGRHVGRLRGRGLALVGALLVLVAVPLTVGTLSVTHDRQLAADAGPVARRWADGHGWEVEAVSARDGKVEITVVGLPPAPDPEGLRAALDGAGAGDAPLLLHVLGGDSLLCPAHGGQCKAAHTATVPNPAS
ncbi:DUF389 domain-containing protein [Catenulispora yoronensis]|uniref:DUF389 domain-containing protein n=1 Tax=Catenulispora yoronensis TaxID=450799 RepID=A0ABP5F172_9ACTN